LCVDAVRRFLGDPRVRERDRRRDLARRDPDAGDARERREEIAPRDVVVAEDVPLADLALLLGEEMSSATTSTSTTFTPPAV